MEFLRAPDGEVRVTGDPGRPLQALSTILSGTDAGDRAIEALCARESLAPRRSRLTAADTGALPHDTAEFPPLLRGLKAGEVRCARFEQLRQLGRETSARSGTRPESAVERLDVRALRRLARLDQAHHERY
jgi:hypothetical protein